MVEAAGKTFGLADCKQHTTEKDCWLIIGGKVYNVTDFLDEHPGGFDIIISATGKSALVLQAVLLQQCAAWLHQQSETYHCASLA